MKISHKSVNVGSKNGMAKIRDKDIIVIKQLYKRNLTQIKIAEMFNVQQSAISRIVNGVRRVNG